MRGITYYGCGHGHICADGSSQTCHEPEQRVCLRMRYVFQSLYRDTVIVSHTHFSYPPPPPPPLLPLPPLPPPPLLLLHPLPLHSFRAKKGVLWSEIQAEKTCIHCQSGKSYWLPNGSPRASLGPGAEMFPGPPIYLTVWAPLKIRSPVWTVLALKKPFITGPGGGGGWGGGGGGGGGGGDMVLKAQAC